MGDGDPEILLFCLVNPFLYQCRLIFYLKVPCGTACRSSFSIGNAGPTIFHQAVGPTLGQSVGPFLICPPVGLSLIADWIKGMQSPIHGIFTCNKLSRSLVASMFLFFNFIMFYQSHGGYSFDSVKLGLLEFHG